MEDFNCQARIDLSPPCHGGTYRCARTTSHPIFTLYAFSPRWFSGSSNVHCATVTITSNLTTNNQRAMRVIFPEFSRPEDIVKRNVLGRRIVSRGKAEASQNSHRIMHPVYKSVGAPPVKKGNCLWSNFPYREEKGRHFGKLVSVCGDVFKSSEARKSTSLDFPARRRGPLRHPSRRVASYSCKHLLHFPPMHFISLTAFISRRFAHERTPL